MTIRKRCKACGNLVRLRADGTFYNHTKVIRPYNQLQAVTTKNACRGSRRSPEEMINVTGTG